MTFNPGDMPSSAIPTFDDEFNSLSLWNGSSGTWATNFIFADPNGNGSSLSSNGEQEWYINAQYAPTASVTPWTVNNGLMTLTAALAAPSIQPLINNYQYTSGEINTHTSFSQTYGYFEMRAELPAGQGYWPAFWLLPESGAWPPEIDIMEVLGNSPTTLYTTAHSNSTGTETTSGLGSTVANLSTGFHTYGVDWEANFITWYLDGQQVFQVVTPPDMNQPMYMIANLALGGGWPGNVDSTTPIPGQMQIDYIRAYANASGLSAPTSIGTTLATYTLGPGATELQLTGTAPQTGIGNSLGDVITSNDFGSTLIGGSGADTLKAGHGADQLTGGAGHDIFVFNNTPWNAGHITDFTPGTDVLDLRGLFTAAGYQGSDPIKDGYLSFVATGAGDTQVYFNAHDASNPWPTLITTLDHVSPASLSATDWLFQTPVSSGGTAAGVTLTADDSGHALTGGAGNDTLIASHSSNVLTGGAGNDTFVFDALPWNASHITDFTPGTDVLDLRGLFAAANYHGTDPVADGYLSFTPDGAGGTIVTFDSHDPSNPWPIQVTTLDHVAPTSLNATDWLFQTAAASTGTAPGITLTANDSAGQTLTGGAGNDTLIAGHNADILAGGAGSDSFVFNALPWNAGHITDFTPGTDVLDLRGIFAAAGYHGTDPVKDGYLSFTSDGAGDTTVTFDSHDPSNPWPIQVTTLDHVAPASLSATDWLFQTAAPAALVLTANDNAGQTLTGGAGNDTLIAGHNADILTGGAGSDTFVFSYLPWNAGHVTDFTAGTDVLDLRALFTAAGYHGADPVGDGYVSFASDSAGDTKIFFDPHGQGAAMPIQITTLDHVSPANLHAQADWLYH